MEVILRRFEPNDITKIKYFSKFQTLGNKQMHLGKIGLMMKIMN